MRWWATFWAVVLWMLVAAGCGSSTEEAEPAETEVPTTADATTTTSTADTAPTTEAELEASTSTLAEELTNPLDRPRRPLEPSLTAFIGRWNQTVEILVEENPDASPLVLNEGDFVTGPASDGSQLFLTEFGDNVFVGATTDPTTGAVTTVIYAGGSDGGDGGTVLLATSALLSLDDENFAEIAGATTSVRDGSPGDSRYVAGPTNDYVITLEPLAAGGPPVVVTVVGATTDEASARAHAATIQPELLALLG